MRAGRTLHVRQVEPAAAQGNLELVNALLKSGGTGAPGLRGCRGRTLLDAAAEGGNEKVVSAILKAGAMPDLSVRSGSKRRYTVKAHGGGEGGGFWSENLRGEIFQVGNLAS